MSKVNLLFLFFFVMVGCSQETNSCPLKEEFIHYKAEGQFGISPNHSGLVTITVFTDETLTDQFRTDLKQSIKTCEIDYIVYVEKPNSVMEYHYDINFYPTIIIGGQNEKVLLKTSSLIELKDYFY